MTAALHLIKDSTSTGMKLQASFLRSPNSMIIDGHTCPDLCVLRNEREGEGKLAQIVVLCHMIHRGAAISIKGSTCTIQQLDACRDHYTPLDETAIPTGEIAPVAGTPFDFSEEHSIRETIDQVAGGYDHNYVLFGMGRQAKFIVKNGAASNTYAPYCPKSNLLTVSMIALHCTQVSVCLKSDMLKSTGQRPTHYHHICD